MKVLKLTMCHKWYDMIESGEKQVEYREIKKHWVKTLTLFPHFDSYAIQWFYVDFKHYDAVQFFRGAYLSEKLPNMTFELKNIKIDFGKKEWGAVEGTKYFCLELGNKITKTETQNETAKA